MAATNKTYRRIARRVVSTENLTSGSSWKQIQAETTLKRFQYCRREIAPPQPNYFVCRMPLSDKITHPVLDSDSDGNQHTEQKPQPEVSCILRLVVDAYYRAQNYKIIKNNKSKL